MKELSKKVSEAVLKFMLVLFIAGLLFVSVLYVGVKRDNQVLTKLGAVKDTVNTHNQGEFVKLKGSFQYQWITKYNDSITNQTKKVK